MSAKPEPCKCGNKVSCDLVGGIALYRIHGDGVARLDPVAARKCEKLKSSVAEAAREGE